MSESKPKRDLEAALARIISHGNIVYDLFLDVFEELESLKTEIQRLKKGEAKMSESKIGITDALVEVVCCECLNCKDYPDLKPLDECLQLCATVFDKGRVKLHCGNFEPALTLEEKVKAEAEADLAQEKGEIEADLKLLYE